MCISHLSYWKALQLFLSCLPSLLCPLLRSFFTGRSRDFWLSFKNICGVSGRIIWLCIYEWVERILPTPAELLLDNSMLEDEKASFKDGFKGRKMSEHHVVRQTWNLCGGNRAEGAKHLKKWWELEAEGLRSKEGDVLEGNVTRYLRVKTWKLMWFRNTWKSSCKVSEGR